MARVTIHLKSKAGKTSPLRAFTSFYGHQYETALRVSVPVKFWNAKKYRCSATFNEAAHINAMLDEWERLLLGVAHKFEQSLAAPDKQDFAAAVNIELKKRAGFTDGSKSPYLVDFAQQFVASCNKTAQRIRTLKLNLHRLERYETEARSRVRFDRLDYNFYNAYRAWLISQNYAKNTIGRAIKDFVFFANEARRQGYHDNALNGFVCESEDTDAIYLTTDELLRLHHLDVTADMLRATLCFEGSEDEASRHIQFLHDCKDLFLIGAFTALRFSDFSTLDGLRSTDAVITKRTKKTGERVTIPMHYVVREILQRRNNALPAVRNNSAMNAALKELGKLAGIDDEVEQTITRGGRRTTTRHKKYELISTHTARRSGCTNMYLAGIDMYTIMGFSGHKSTATFLRYVRVKQEENARRYIEHPYFREAIPQI